MQEPPSRNIPYSAKKRRMALLSEWLAVPCTWICRRAGREPSKILLVEPFMLGDASFLTVMLDPLKARFPHAELHLLIQPKCAPLYQADPRVAKIHAYHMPWIQQRGEGSRRWNHFLRAVMALRRERIDMAIDVRGEVRSQILAVLAGIPQRVGFVNYLCSNMVVRGRLLTHNAGMLPLQHRIHTCLDLCEQAGCTVDRSSWLPFAADRKIACPQRIMVHTGAGGGLRAWPTDRWGLLLAHLHDLCDARFILVGTQVEAAQNHTIARQAGFGVEVRITPGIEDLLREIEACDLLICLDSAPLHFAVLRRKPVLALFGPGPAQLYRPISPGSRIVHHQELYPCAPCAQQRCVQPVEAACMKAITVQEVVDAFRSMIHQLDPVI